MAAQVDSIAASSQQSPVDPSSSLASVGAADLSAATIDLPCDPSDVASRHDARRLRRQGCQVMTGTPMLAATGV